MTFRIDQIASVLDRASLGYVKADSTTLVMPFTSKNVTLKLTLRLMEEGEYLEIRTFMLARCAADAPEFEATLAEINRVNARLKLAKVGWDESDGEIVINVDVAAGSQSEFTQTQLLGMLFALAAAADDLMPALEHCQRGGARRASRAVDVEASTPAPSQPTNMIAFAIVGVAALLWVIYLFAKP